VKRTGLLVAALLLAALPARADEKPVEKPRLKLMDVHRALGTVALGAFASSLVIGSATGNIGKLMDPARCCPDGGARLQPWRTTDRVLVTTGIIAYLGAASLATYNLTIHDPPRDDHRRVAHHPHRWLALAHGAAFATSAITGYIMFRSQSSNPERFATAAKVHVASNVVLVPLLTAAFSDILFE
jgi:hypothetical protein